MRQLVYLMLLVTMSGSVQAVRDRDNLTLYQFATSVARQLEFNLLFSPRVRQDLHINLELQKEFTDQRLYALFLDTLSLHGYAALRDGDLVTIIRERGTRQHPLNRFIEQK